MKQILKMLTAKDPDKEVVLNKVIQTICDVLKTECCLAFEFNEQQQALQITGGTDCVDLSLIVNLEDDQRWDVAHAFKNKKPVIIEDYQKKEQLSKIPFINCTIRSGANVIIRGSEKSYGVLGIYSEQPRRFSESEINFLQVSAIILGVTLERIEDRKKHENIHQSFKDKIERMKNLQREILRTNVYEKWQLGKYLNEELAQDLLAIDLIIRSMLQNLDHQGTSVDIDDWDKILNRIVKDTQEIQNQIAPVDLEDQGIFYSFKHFVSQIEDTYEVQCNLTSGKNLLKINDVEIATHLYRIAQETVKNAILYRQADSIKLVCSINDNQICLLIKDDGERHSSALLKSSAMGFDIIEHQIELLDGSLEIKMNGVEEKGLEVVLKIPLPKDITFS